MLMADIESGIDERKHLHVFAVRCTRAGWALSVAAVVWLFDLVALLCCSWSV